MTSIPPVRSTAPAPQAAPAARREVVLQDEPVGVPKLVQDEAKRADSAQDFLIADTAKQLGVSIPSAGPSIQTSDARRAAALADPFPRGVRKDTGTIDIPIGASVLTGASDETSPYTLLAVNGKTATVARTRLDGSVERTDVKAADLFERDPSFVPNSFRDAKGEPWILATNPNDVYEGVRALGKDASVQIVPSSALTTTRGEDGWSTNVTDPAQLVHTTWGDFLGATGAATAKLRGTAPDVDGIGSLRALLGDKTTVVDSVAENVGGASRTTATDAHHGTRADVIKDAHETSSWFQRTTGLKPWDDGSTDLQLLTSSPFGLANASAARTSRNAYILEGPRDYKLRSTLQNEFHGDHGQAVKKIGKLLREYDLPVRSHEGGHAAMNSVWGSRWRAGSDNATKLQELEYGVVHEAMADLFGTSRAKIASVGVRDVDTRNSASGSLDRLRTLLAEGRVEQHSGTQLLTAPMVDNIAKSIGWNAMGEIGGAAVQQVSTELAERQVPITIPQMAAALRDRAAARLGADSKEVLGLERDWRALGVLTDGKDVSAADQVEVARTH